MQNWFNDLSYIISSINIFSLAITFSLIVFLLLNKKKINANTGLFMLSAIFLWSAMQLVEFSVQGVENKLFFHQLKYLGILSVPGSWLLFSFDFTGRYTKYMNRLIPVIGIAYPLALWSIYFTNDWHHLFWQGYTLTADGRYVILNTSSPYIFIIISIYIPVIAAFTMLFIFINKIPSIKKPLLRILTIAGLLPFVLKTVDLVFGAVNSSYDTSIISFGLISFMVILALKRRHYKNIPTAHDEIVQQTQDPVVVTTENNEIIYANPAAFKLCQGENSYEKQNDFFIIMHLLFANQSQSSQRIVELGNCVYDARYFPILKKNKKIINKVFVLRETTRLYDVQKQLENINLELEKRVEIRTDELNRANIILNEEIKKKEEITDILSQSLNEKRILLGELHHRVKNNLQIISSLLKLQLRRLNTDEAKEVFRTAVSRIHVIAMIHEKLYKNEDFTHADLNKYLTSLINYITSAYKENSGKIALSLDIDQITLVMNQSLLVGLIINELVSNSLKHGFGPDEAILLTVSFKLRGKTCFCQYSDNGKGVLENSFLGEKQGLGSKIITTLIHQLHGSYDFQSSKIGFQFDFSFPLL